MSRKAAPKGQGAWDIFIAEERPTNHTRLGKFEARRRFSARLKKSCEKRRKKILDVEERSYINLAGETQLYQPGIRRKCANTRCLEEKESQRSEIFLTGGKKKRRVKASEGPAERGRAGKDRKKTVSRELAEEFNAGRGSLKTVWDAWGGTRIEGGDGLRRSSRG